MNQPTTLRTPYLFTNSIETSIEYSATKLFVIIVRTRPLSLFIKGGGRLFKIDGNRGGLKMGGKGGEG